jgi:outer membrane protein OmpA-like peptidoglycan-associated protein
MIAAMGIFTQFMPQLRAQVAQRLPDPVNFRERVALELDGFSEYAAEVTPEQQQKIDALAVEIIRSNQTNDPIFAFRVEGHADIARRISDPVERKALEDTVSLERAENGRDLLLEAIKRKSRDDALVRKMTQGSKSFGLGTSRLKVPNASTEAQFKQNRRVVFVIRQVTFLPIPPEPPPSPSSVVEDRFSVRMIKGLIVTIGMPTSKAVPLTPTSVTVTVTLEIKDHIIKQVAQFNVLGTGVGFGGGPIPVGGSLSLSPGNEVRFKTFRLLGKFAKPPSLVDFDGTCTVFMDGGTGVATKSVGGALSYSFDALEKSGLNTMPTVINVPGGASVSLPGVDLGAVMPLARITIIGSPSSF